MPRDKKEAEIQKWLKNKACFIADVNFVTYTKRELVVADSRQQANEYLEQFPGSVIIDELSKITVCPKTN